MKLWTLTVTLTVNTATPNFSQDIPAYDDVPYTKFGCKRISS